MISIRSKATIARYQLTRQKQILANPTKLRRSFETGHEPENGAPPRFIRKNYEIMRRDVRGFPYYTLLPRATTSNRHIFYLHGGAYIHQVERAHWRFLSKLCDRIGCPISIPIYPLTPVHQYDTTLPMVLDSYKAVLASTAPENQIIMGDSAGGGLSLFLAQQLKQQEAHQPARIMLISPWLDITVTDRCPKTLTGPIRFSAPSDFMK